MSQEPTLLDQEPPPFDYAALPVEDAELCQIVEVRIKTRTGMTIFENGRDLITVKERLGHGKFTEWLESWFPKSEWTARKWMRIAEEYKGKTGVTTVLGSEALGLLCSSTMPESVREEIERRAVEGGDTSIAEIQRLKAEHKAENERLAQESAKFKAEAEASGRTQAKLKADLDALEAKSKEKAEKASRREANLIADKERANKALEAAEARIEEAREIAAQKATEEADEKYETRINQLYREAQEANKKLAEYKAELDKNIKKAKADAEKAAEEMAEALVQKALETRKKELSEIEERYQRSLKNAQGALGAVERAKRDLEITKELIAKNEAEMARWASGEAETADQVKVAKIIADALGDAMAELMMLEHGPQPAAVQKLEKAASMCRQMADAIDNFLIPKLA